MSTSSSNALDDGNIRRVRSMGDMPQRPTTSLPSASVRRTSNGDLLPGAGTIPPPFTAAARNRNQTQDPGPYYDRMDSFLAFFGLGRSGIQKRKALAALLWNIVWSLAQTVVIVTMVALSGTVFRNPKEPGSSEWSACDRPLGIWACLWIVRVISSTALSYWEYLRELDVIQTFIRGTPTIIRRGNRTSTIPRADSRQLQPIRQQGIIVPPPNAAYTRLSVLSSLLTLSWFLTAHILEYTSINTCRHTSPHLWWLVFGILCIMYLMVFEVIIIGFIVLVITPIVFVFWNILLICLGRHPIQNPHIIKPDIDKMPKALVEKIPLVMYIPPPPEGSDFKSTSPKIITNPHTYPPNASPKSANKPKPRFRFLKPRSLRKKQVSSNATGLPVDVEKHPGTGEPLTWSDYWEDSEYPFVVLEGNRAACAICLMDFEEPKRKPGFEHTFATIEKKETVEETVVATVDNDMKKEEAVELEAKPADTEVTQTSGSGITLEVREGGANHIQLEDAGEEAQPLRLLTCGHVFHKTCLDPWLTDVSGRCPVCQRPVEIPGQTPRRP